MTPTRWAAVLCLLACAASAQRLDRLQRRLDRRDRLGGTGGGALLQAFPPTSPAGFAFTRGGDSSCVADDGSYSVVVANTPCFTSGRLTIYPSATNLVLQADRQALDSAGWAKTGTGVAAPAVTANAATGPGGGATADKVDFPAAATVGDVSTLSKSFTSTRTGYTLAVSARAVSGTAATYLWAQEGGVYSRRLCSADDTGWVRCMLPFAAFGGTVTYGLGVDLTSGSGMSARAAASFYLTDVQLEATAYATPYVSAGARQVPSVASLSNPVPTGAPSWCVAYTLDPAIAWRDGNHFIASVGGTATANSAHFNIVTGRAVFRVYDAAGVAKEFAGDFFQGHLFSYGPQHQVMGCTNNGTLSMYLNGQPYPGTVTGTGTGIITTQPATVYVGHSSNTASIPHGAVSLCFGLQPSDCAATPVQPPDKATRVAFLGDSITRQIIGGEYTMPSMMQALRPDIDVQNHGIVGDTSAGALTRWRNNIRGRGFTHLPVLIGTNDMSQSITAVAAFANTQTILDEARTDGLTVVLVTLLPRTGSSGWSPAKQAELEAYNTLLRDYCTNYSLACVDAYSFMADTVDPTALLAAYDSGDRLHPSKAGNDRLFVAVLGALGL